MKATPVGMRRPVMNGLDVLLAAIVGDGVDRADVERADEQRALVAPAPSAAPGERRCAQTSILKPGGSLIFFILAQFGFRAPVGRPDGGARPFCASVSSPRNQSSGGWVQKSLVPDSVTFELLLGASLSDPHDGEDRSTRKNGSIESRFHRVTPYAAERLRMLIYFEGFEGRTFWSDGSPMFRRR